MLLKTSLPEASLGNRPRLGPSSLKHWRKRAMSVLYTALSAPVDCPGSPTPASSDGPWPVSRGPVSAPVDCLPTRPVSAPVDCLPTARVRLSAPVDCHLTLS